jgi:uncharacterized protein YjbI with pentapeptide repeats
MCIIHYLTFIIHHLTLKKMVTPQSLGLHLQEWTKELSALEFLAKFNEFFADKPISKEWIIEWQIFINEIPLEKKHEYLQYAVLNFREWILLNFWDKNQIFPVNINPENAVLNSFRALWACFSYMNEFHFNFLPPEIDLKDRFVYLVKRSLWEDICLNGQDFSKADLSYWDLENANVRYANFDNVTLFYGKFKNCDFSHSSFKSINMSYAIFEKCFLVHTDFKNANIPQNNWKNCIFFDPNFYACEMSISDFDDSYLTHANFEQANLVWSVFTDTQIYKGNFRKARISHCDFGRANLRESTLLNSDISESQFIFADLTDVHIDAHLAENTNFQNADISQQSKNILLKKGAKF